MRASGQHISSYTRGLLVRSEKGEWMMPAPIGTNLEIVAIAHCLTTGGQLKAVVNSYHYSATVAPGAPPPKGNIFTAWNSSIFAGIASKLSVDYVAVQTTIRFIDDASDAPTNCGPQNNGAAAVGHLDLATAVVFYLKTNLRGKEYRGFKHYGPITPLDGSGDELSVAGYANWNPLTSNHTNSFSNGGWTWVPVILSRKLSTLITNPTTVVATPITSARCNKTLGTMRHRREKTVF